MSYMIDKMSSGRNYYKQRSAEENCCNRDRTAPPYHRDLRGRFWHWGRRCCNLGRSSGWFFTDNVRFLRTQPYEPHDSWSKTPVVRITSIRGVGKNLVRDTDPVEWDSYSISPDLIKIYQQKASAFHRNVMGRGLFCVKKKAARKRKRYPPYGKWRIPFLWHRCLKSHLILSWLYLGFNRKHHKCITFDPEKTSRKPDCFCIMPSSV